MLPTKEFIGQVEDAYAHLYDLAYLRTHPLAGLLCADAALSSNEKAWHLHHLLTEVIGELKPAPQVPVASRPWRRHQLMSLRYIRGLTMQAVAAELGISNRHCYREHRIAIEALAAILWSRRAGTLPGASVVSSEACQDQGSLSHLELLRLETARVAQADRFGHLCAVVEGTLGILGRMLEDHGVQLQIQLPQLLPTVSVGESLLRQLLLSVMEYLIEPVHGGTLRLTAQPKGTMIQLTIRLDLDPTARQASPPRTGDKLSAIQELASLGRIPLDVVSTRESIIICTLELPVAERTVLVVDDNQDVLELFRRYLSPHHYHVVTARGAQEALALARQLKPYAITLDLMMPGQDGWNVLQTLLTQPETSRIPVIVCTVLRQKALALSLGASAFLEKPVSGEALLAALSAIDG